MPLLYFIKKLLDLINNSLKSLRIINGKVGKNLTVYFNTSLMKITHQLRVRKSFKASCSIYTLNPQCAEVTLLGTTIAESISKTFFPSIFSYGPYVFTRTIITAGKFQNSLSLCSRSNVVY